jgi:nicotinate-nucleotide adenylyltransferase
MTETDSRIGILGGTFNPVHYGHLRASEEVRERTGLEKILFIPSGNPPLKDRELASSEYRYEMTRLAIMSNPSFEISDIECKKTGKSYTADTLMALREMHPGKKFYFILGIDSFLDIPLWYHPERLLGLTNFVVVSRPGFSFRQLSSRFAADAEAFSALESAHLSIYRTVLDNGGEVFLMNVTPMDISASTIRKLVKQGSSIKYLLPESVESFIISHNLYREGSDHL